MPAVRAKKEIKTEVREESEYGSRLPDSKLSKSELEKRNRRRARNREAAARQRDKRVARDDALETEKQEIETSNQKLKMENDQLKNEIVQVNFKNPLYFKTSKERLSNANFEIVDFTTEEQPYFGIGSPTYIHCLVRGIGDRKTHNEAAI